MLRSLFAILIFLLPLISSGQNSKLPKDQPVFTVAGNAVTADEFIYLYKKNHQNKAEEFTNEKIEEYLNLFINFKLKVTEAKNRGLDTTQVFTKEFNTYKDELRKPYLPDSKLVDSLVKLTYNRLKEEVHASHILIKVKPDASPEDTLAAYKKIAELRNRAMAGEDFAKLAYESSEDPSARMNKGDLGYFTALQMVYPFESAAYQTPKGETSQPFRTSFGYHILKVYDKRPARGQVEVSHIMIRTGENKDNTQSKNKIFEIYDELQKGVNWNELVQQNSEDLSSKNNGGKLRPFGVGEMSSAPEFENIAFNLKNPGDISDPFQTQYGWHIVKLEQKIPLPAFEEIAPSLKNKVSRDERVQVSKQAVYAKMKREFQFTEDANLKNKVFALGDSTLTTGVWKASAYPNADKEVLFKLAGKSYSVREYFNYVVKNQRSNTSTPQQYLGQLYNAFVEKNLLDEFEQKIKNESPEYRWLLKEYYEGILLFDIMEKEVWNKASEDSVGQRKYFSANQQNYKAGERIKGDIYSATTKDHIDQLKLAIERGDSTKAAELISNLKIKHESGLFEKNDRIVLTKVSWAPGLYLTENNNVHYLVKIDTMVPPSNKTFEEARPEVISDYQNFLEQQWIEQLKKKYPVKVNKKGKAFVFEQLVKENVKS